MAYDEGIQTYSMPANADLSASQYCMVSINSSGNIAVTGDGARADGVLYNKPAAAARSGEVALSGLVKMKFGASINPGSEFASDASGRAVAVATSDEPCGVVVSDGGAANAIGTVIFNPMMQTTAAA